MLTLILMGLSFAAGFAVGVQVAQLPLLGGLLLVTGAAAVAARPSTDDLLTTRRQDYSPLQRAEQARRQRERRTHDRRHP